MNNVHIDAKEAITGYHMPEIPEWQKIPDLMFVTAETLKYRRAPLQDILAVMEAIFFSLRQKVNYHMGTFDSQEIMAFGERLDSVSAYLDLAGDELILHGNIEGAVGNLWPIFPLVREVWNQLFARGYIA